MFKSLMFLGFIIGRLSIQSVIADDKVISTHTESLNVSCIITDTEGISVRGAGSAQLLEAYGSVSSQVFVRAQDRRALVLLEIDRPVPGSGLDGPWVVSAETLSAASQDPNTGVFLSYNNVHLSPGDQRGASFSGGNPSGLIVGCKIEITNN